MFDDNKLYRDTLPQGLLAALGSVFMYVPQIACICAYAWAYFVILRGALPHMCHFAQVCWTHTMCHHLCLRAQWWKYVLSLRLPFGQSFSVYPISISRLDESGVQRLRGFWDYPELRHPFKLQRFHCGLAADSRRNTKSRPHKQHYTLASTRCGKAVRSSSKNITPKKQNNEVFACCENVYLQNEAVRAEMIAYTMDGPWLRTLLKYSVLQN